MESVGAVAFGLVIGWVTYRTLRRSDETGVSDIASVVGAVGGAVVTMLADDLVLFSWYALGLAVGFFSYLAVAFLLNGNDEVGEWLGRH